jgi:predicted nucleic acid-binding protein
MNLVDSSGWLEYFAGTSKAKFFAPPIEDINALIVPTICLLEVFKRILQQRGEQAALQAVVQMRLAQIVDLDAALALNAAKIGHELKLALADSIILATARRFDATLWTQDADFERLPGVRFQPKK